MNVDSAKQNLASSFVNAFVNVGFGNDKLIINNPSSVSDSSATKEPVTAPPSTDANWIYKNKEHGMTSATASIGAIMLWDVEMGLSQLDKFLYSDQDWIKVCRLNFAWINS